MRVLLHDNQICERGTTTSLLDYARVLRARGHEVEISYWRDSPANVPSIISHVREEFPLHPHSEPHLLPASLTNFDASYFIKAGANDGMILPNSQCLIHVVFQNYDPHGSKYAYVSEWLANKMRARVMSRQGKREGLQDKGWSAITTGCENALSFDHLDHIVDIPAPQLGARASLGIPEEAFVIMRFGAFDSFDVGWVHSLVSQSLQENNNWYFLGLNTRPFIDHPRARFLPLVPDNVEKSSIIAAGDLFLTARGEGEAFGIAIAEALQIGLPVLAWQGGVYNNQVSMLNGLGGLFRGPRDLRRKLRHLANGRDPSSRKERQARGDRYRPSVVGPRLESLLTP